MYCYFLCVLILFINFIAFNNVLAIGYATARAVNVHKRYLVLNPFISLNDGAVAIGSIQSLDPEQIKVAICV